MPTLAEKLTRSSSDGQISAAISDTIRQLMNEGMEQEQAIAAAHEMARKSTGKPLERKT